MEDGVGAKEGYKPLTINTVYGMSIKKPINLLLVNICCISAIGFY